MCSNCKQEHRHIFHNCCQEVNFDQDKGENRCSAVNVDSQEVDQLSTCQFSKVNLNCICSNRYQSDINPFFSGNYNFKLSQESKFSRCNRNFSSNTQSFDFTGEQILSCPWCGGSHGRRCPFVSTIWFHPNGAIAGVTFLRDPNVDHYYDQTSKNSTESERNEKFQDKRE